MGGQSHVVSAKFREILVLNISCTFLIFFIVAHGSTSVFVSIPDNKSKRKGVKTPGHTYFFDLNHSCKEGWMTIFCHGLEPFAHTIECKNEI